jgi:hypothetical protein
VATLAQLGSEILPRLQSAGNTVGRNKNTASESGGSSNVILLWSLKGQCPETFCFRFFYESYSVEKTRPGSAQAAVGKTRPGLM